MFTNELMAINILTLATLVYIDNASAILRSKKNKVFMLEYLQTNKQTYTEYLRVIFYTIVTWLLCRFVYRTEPVSTDHLSE